MSYVDLNTIHNPATGTVAPASWGDQVRENDEFLVDPPACSVFNNAVQAFTTGVAAAFTANTENYDTDAMHSTVSNTSRITIVTAGLYLFTCTVLFAANGTGSRQILFRYDGVTGFGGQAVGAQAATMRLSASWPIRLNAAQYVECLGTQTSGGNLNLTLEEFGAVFLAR